MMRESWRGHTFATLAAGLLASSLVCTLYAAPPKYTSGGTAEGGFGNAVAVDGDTMVVGAPNENKAYVFRRTITGGVAAWGAPVSLSVSEARGFGTAVAVSGSTIVVGAPTTSNSNGAAYVYTYVSGSWSGPVSLPAIGSSAEAFGSSLSISGNYLVVGSPKYSVNYGAASLFVLSGSSWAVSQQFGALAANGSFGASVSTDGVSVFVGEPGNIKGLVHVYKIAAWSNPVTIDRGSSYTASDHFGASVSGKGNSVVIGAPGTNPGKAYVFSYSGGAWTQQAALSPWDIGSTSHQASFGRTVAMIDDTVLVGAGGSLEDLPPYTVGAAYLFSRSNDTWIKQSPVLWPPGAAPPSMLYGAAVALSSNDIVIGAPRDLTGSTQTGAVYAYPYACGFGPAVTTGEWSMFGLSCQPASGTTVGTFFSGLPSTGYGSSWIVYSKNNTTNAYATVPYAGALTQGTGYWFKTLTDLTRLTLSSSTTTLSTTHCDPPCYEIPLTSISGSQNSFNNLISHPLAFDVTWDNVRILCNSTGRTPSEAQADNILSKTYWGYAGSNVYQAYGTASDPLPGTLRAGEALWVRALPGSSSCGSSFALLVPQSSPPTVRALFAPATGSAGGWFVRLQAEAAAAKLKSGWVALGQMYDALAGFDSRDMPAMAPAFSPYVNMAFPHTDWGSKSDNYAADIHAVHAGADTWSFQVQSEAAGKRVTLSWKITDSAPPNMSLLDTATGTTTPVQNGSYTFTMTAPTRTFTWRAFNWVAR